MRKGTVHFIATLRGIEGVYSEYTGSFFQFDNGISVTEYGDYEKGIPRREFFVPMSNVRNIVYGDN